MQKTYVGFGIECSYLILLQLWLEVMEGREEKPWKQAE